ncbi:hypothetical protein Taro_037082 [Colocasia esculenta]|uniref:Methyltransferase n=1 Tax=Colocasia esculenta TaxID=4460 RepID=A0A843WJQ3_COLES|nr:hypothetical protein [Colocasia esculenta]
MQELGITIVSTAFDVGAPYSEAITIRGLVPLHATMNQRLPFFDNTMDLIHTSGVLDGWVNLQLMDFVLFDWDLMLRLGGLLWINGFIVCERKYLDDYSYMFQQFRYRKHRWVVSPKSGDDFYLSALLEKPAHYDDRCGLTSKHKCLRPNDQILQCVLRRIYQQSEKRRRQMDQTIN